MNVVLNKLYITGSSIKIIIAAVFLTACASLTSDIEINVQGNPDLNINKYKTYAWAGSAQVVFDPIGQWEKPTLDTDEEVRFVINRELSKRGLYQAARNPDLLVAFVAGVDTTVLKLKEDPEQDNKVLTNIPQAALAITLVDTETGYPVWSGYAIGKVQEQQPIENIRARIDYAVTRIFSTLNK